MYGLWRESTIPIDVDPPHRRPATTPITAAPWPPCWNGVSAPLSGAVLPLDRVDDRWRTSTWPLRRSQLFLAPGTSPMGLRLPLDTLPDDPATWPDPVVEPDPLEAATTVAPRR